MCICVCKFTSNKWRSSEYVVLLKELLKIEGSELIRKVWGAEGIILALVLLKDNSRKPQQIDRPRFIFPF